MGKEICVGRWGEWNRKLAVQAARGRKGRKELGVMVSQACCASRQGAQGSQGAGGEWYRELAVQAARGRKGRKELGVMVSQACCASRQGAQGAGVNGIASLLCKPPGGARVAKGWGE